MSELVTHMRKDIKLLTSDAMFAILIVVLAALSLIVAFMQGSSYVNHVLTQSPIVTQHSVLVDQKLYLAQYWTQLIGVESVILTVVAAMSMTVEKDSGMLRFTLASNTKKMPFFLSKFIVLFMIVVISTFLGLIAYLIAFATMDMPIISADVLLASMLFPFLALMTFTTLGLALASFSGKKGMAVVMAVVLFFVLSLMFSMSVGYGWGQAYKTHNYLSNENVTQYMPLDAKVLIDANPIVLGYGTYQCLGLSVIDMQNQLPGPVMYDALGGALLGIGMTVGLFFLGFALFTRERPRESEQGKWWTLKAS